MNRARRLLWAWICVATAALLITGCASTPPERPASGAPGTASDTATRRGGGYYQNDGPPDDEDIDLSEVPDAVPRVEPPSRYGNPDSYEALGKEYYVLSSAAGFSQTGRASWYGRQFHGRRTSSGEPYNMYKMTAAHKRLPIPSYVRVTNLDNNRSTVVRVNDRGPFREGRIIDLSYVAARKLDIVTHGSAPVHIETVTPASLRAERNARDNRPPSRRRRAPTPEPKPQAEPNTRITVSADPAPPPARQAVPIDNRIETAAAAPAADGGLYLQIGAFGDAANARRQGEALQRAGYQPVAILPPAGDASLHRVRLGPFDDDRSRALTRQILMNEGFNVRAVDD